jgi:hypothetical protein
MYNAEYQKEYRQKNKERIAEYEKEYRQKNKERIAEYDKEYYQKNKESIAEWQKEYDKSRAKPTTEVYRYFGDRASKLKTKSRKNKIPYDLDGKYLQSIYPEDGKCPALNVEMKAGSDSDWRLSPSVDRIDPSGGYVRGNVIWISWLANCIKSSATPEQIITVGEFYKQLEAETHLHLHLNVLNATIASKKEKSLTQ